MSGTGETGSCGTLGQQETEQALGGIWPRAFSWPECLACGELTTKSPPIVRVSRLCYNTLLKGARMYDQYKLQIDSVMLQLQALIDQEFEENESIQNAFNALACALDEEML